jgi:hypothetical protein
MKRTILVLAATLAAFGLLVVSAAALKAFSSHVTIRGTDGQFSDLYVFGNVSSSQPRCVADRRVRVYKVDSGPNGPVTTLVDTARTSNHGAFAAHGDFTGAVGAKAAAVRRKFGRHHHKVCRATSDSFPFF